jgi:hypothetical protein
MRRLFVLVLALGVLVALGGTAHASGVQNINPYKCSGNPWVVSAAESGGDPVQLSFGWAALQPSQLDKFIAAEFGSVTLTAPDGHQVFTESWGSNSSGWDAYSATQVTADGVTFYPGVGTKRHELFGTLSNPLPGTDAVYSLTMDWEVNQTVKDGFSAWNPKTNGPIVHVTNCPVIVRNFNSP